MCLSTIYWAHIEKVYYANSSKDAQHIGFDDKHIFNELTKDKSQREIPIIQILPEEGKAVFNAWIEKLDKTLY